MIRDGAAWFDPRNMDRLSSTDREVYQQSELAARSEKRGLWQQPNPTAPWEFVKALAAYKNPAASNLNCKCPPANKTGRFPRIWINEFDATGHAGECCSFTPNDPKRD